jgi:paraquat-inducible protein B
MSDTTPAAVIHARGHRRRRLSFIWAIPLVTALLGAWLVWHTLDERGPLITVSFQTAEGLTANQSKVRHKDVEMGSVERVDLSPDLKHVVVTIRMNKEATPLLTDKARFWVVKPRFFAGSVSGLSTILSGAYIELRPSAEPGEAKRTFVGLEDPPVLQADVPGTAYRLTAARIGSISLGSPIFFRDQTVGEVLGWDVADMAQSVTIHAFVRAPYDQYVRQTTRFWNASGLSVELGAQGLQVQLESVRALILGGIAFDTPADGLTAPRSEQDHTYTLHPSKEAADSALYLRSPPLAAVFKGSVAGLAKGSQVRLRGIKIGEVESVDLEYDRAQDSVAAVARFTVEPNRIGHMALPINIPIQMRLAGLIHRGLRVKLESGNLLTGSKILSLDLYPDAEPASLTMRGGAMVLPVLEGAGTDVMASAGALMDKLSAIPFEAIGKNLNDTLAGTNTLVNDPELMALAAVLRRTLDTTQTFIQTLNRGVEPVAQRLPAIATHLDDAIRRTDRLIASIETGYGNNSALNRDANRLLVQLADAARSIRVLADLLTRHPEALIRGRTSQGP